MKKISILFCLLIFLTTSFAKMEIPQPTTQFFVNDFADVITKSDEDEIFNISRELYEKSGNSTQLVVVTIDSLDGYSIEEYANELFNKWGIGDKEKNDGVLVLLSVGDRRSRIEVGYGLEGILTDSGTGKIQDEYMIPYYKNNEFSKGLVSGVQAISNKIDNIEAITPTISSTNNDVFVDDVYAILKILLFILIFCGLFILIFYGLYTMSTSVYRYINDKPIDYYPNKRTRMLNVILNIMLVILCIIFLWTKWVIVFMGIIIGILKYLKNMKKCYKCSSKKIMKSEISLERIGDIERKRIFFVCETCGASYYRDYKIAHTPSNSGGGGFSGGGGSFSGGFSGGRGSSGGGGSSRSF